MTHARAPRGGVDVLGQLDRGTWGDEVGFVGARERGFQRLHPGQVRLDDLDVEPVQHPGFLRGMHQCARGRAARGQVARDLPAGLPGGAKANDH